MRFFYSQKTALESPGWHISKKWYVNGMFVSRAIRLNDAPHLIFCVNFTLCFCVNNTQKIISNTNKYLSRNNIA